MNGRFMCVGEVKVQLKVLKVNIENNGNYFKMVNDFCIK